MDIVSVCANACVYLYVICLLEKQLVALTLATCETFLKIML